MKKGDIKTARELWKSMAQNYRKLAQLEINQLEYTRLLKKARELEQKSGEMETMVPPSDSICSDEGIDAWRFRSNVNFSDIAGMEDVKKNLKYAIGLQLANLPESVPMIDLPCRILLHGKPGCGKTLLASACANTLGAVFYNVKIPDLISKYVGDSSKTIRALYRRARDVADEGLAVVFIDEVDGLIVSRDARHENYEKQVLATFLMELDGLAQKQSRSNVITIVATNKPETLDAAFLSRMDLKIKIELPDEAAREDIFRMQIEKCGFKIDENSIAYNQLAKWTNKRSGRDIEAICKSVRLNVLAEQNSSIPALVDSGKIKNYTLKLRPFSRRDFECVINKDNIDPRNS